ncbi:MAG: hypothetical protein HQL33_05015 [Alphaproteobacteria bacterium]|nr:hypothetical protein [Alphaproteobacteria bacterium]MBF0129329.1 hypothetical protein [Alphaproteobacteria bacterium]
MTKSRGAASSTDGNANEDSISKVLDAVSAYDVTKTEAWGTVQKISEGVEVVAVNAKSHAITLNRDDFSGLLIVNVVFSYTDDDGISYKDAGHINGVFSGKFDAHGEAKIDKVVLTVPDDV